MEDVAIFASWTAEQAAILVLPALIASAVIAIAILAARPWLYIYAAAVGGVGGTILRLTPGGDAVAGAAEGWPACSGSR